MQGDQGTKEATIHIMIYLQNKLKTKQGMGRLQVEICCEKTHNCEKQIYSGFFLINTFGLNINGKVNNFPFFIQTNALEYVW